MAVVIILEGVAADRFEVTVTPAAELAAALHVLTGLSHHPEHQEWATDVLQNSTAEFRTGLHRFSPLWTALRWRPLYPGVGPLAALPVDRFGELTAYACASGYHGFAFDDLRRSPAQATALLQAASRLPQPHLRLAEDLLADPEALRRDVLTFLDLCRRTFFDRLWDGTEPALAGAAHQVRRLLADRGPAAALVSLSPGSARVATSSGGPARVVFDKVHHAVITPARTPVFLIPSRFGAPHLLMKNEPGLPPVIHFPVEPADVGVTLARSRLLALTDPRRVRLCRLIAREAMTTADLADRLAMTRPQVSRHLRVLRDLGLADVERSGRHVHYRLDLAAVERIGRDAATALQH